MINIASLIGKSSGTLTINGISASKTDPSRSAELQRNLADGLRIDQAVQSATDSSSKAKSESVAAETGKQNSSVSENFASEVLKRCRAENGDDPAAAQMLADSLVEAADQIRSELGQERANAFMSQILSATDGGMSENMLTAAVEGFFDETADKMRNDPDLSGKLAGLADSFNSGLNLLLEDEETAAALIDEGEETGLSYAMSRFFGNEINIDPEEESALVKGFDTEMNRVEMKIAKRDEDGEDDWITVRTGANETASSLVGSETATAVADYLRNTVGNENAAAYIESLEPGANFMEAVATSIAIVAEENGQEAAGQYVNYLNDNVASAVSEATNMEFKGWRLGRDYANPEEAPSQNQQDQTLMLGDAAMDDSLMKNKHQGLTTNWLDTSSGVGSGQELDLDDLYQQYKYAAQATAGEKASGAAFQKMNNPVGNLVNLQV